MTPPQTVPTITFTDLALSKVVELLDEQEMRGKAALRIAIQGRRAGRFAYLLALVEGAPDSADEVIDVGEFKVYVDAGTLPDLRGTRVDFVDQLMGAGFKLENPNPLWRDPLALRVQELIDTQINPGIAGHGGHVTLVEVADDRAVLQFGGGCQGCGMVDVTLRQGIETMIKREVPEIREVLDVTDHTRGENPYYSSNEGSSPLE